MTLSPIAGSSQITAALTALGTTALADTRNDLLKQAIIAAANRGGGGAAAWGSITGTLSNQTDLQTALDAKVTAAGGSIANTTDLNADMLTQLSTKAATTGDTFTGPISFSGTTHAGLRLNNLTTGQRDAIAAPAAGMTVWNTTTTRMNLYNGSAWTDGFVRLAGDTMTGVLALPNGSAGTPALNFGDATSGLYRTAADRIGIATAGAVRMDIGVVGGVGACTLYTSSGSSMYLGSGGANVAQLGSSGNNASLCGYWNVTAATGGFASTNRAYPFSFGGDVILSGDAAATLQMGADHATTPTAQTFKAHDVTTGTGASMTIAGGKGSTAGGAVILATSATNGAPVAALTIGADQSATFAGALALARAAATGSPSAALTITTPADTALTASTENTLVSKTAATRQFATGALTTQREVVFGAPTYGFVGASTLTTAINVDIADPIAGTNATITNRYGLRVGNAQVTGTLKLNSDVQGTAGNIIQFSVGSRFQISGMSLLVGSQAAPAALMEAQGTTEQLRLRYDASNYMSVTQSATTGVTFASIASGTAQFTFSQAVNLNGLITVGDAINFALNTTTGSKIATATTQKLGFWNATPIVQPTTAVSGATFVANAGTTVNDASTFDGYTVAQVVKALRNTGLLA